MHVITRATTACFVHSSKDAAITSRDGDHVIAVAADVGDSEFILSRENHSSLGCRKKITSNGIGAKIVDEAELSANGDRIGRKRERHVCDAGAEVHIPIHPELVVPCARSCSLGRELNDSAVQLQIPGGEYGGRCDNTGTKLGGVQSAVVQGDISNRPRSPEGAHI